MSDAPTIATGPAERPWLARYDVGQPPDLQLEHDNALAMFRAALERNPDGDAIRYFDGRITLGELDELTDAFAVALLDSGLVAGDRVALYLQNVPQFVIGLVGTWKAGGIAVPINPMNRQRELQLLLTDSGARVLVCLQSLYRDVAADVVGRTGVETVVTTSELEYQTRNDVRALGGAQGAARPASTVTDSLTSPLTRPLAGRSEAEAIQTEAIEHDMAGLIARFRGQSPPPMTLAPGDTAVLTYTSGTTGPPKGAMNTHGNVVFNSQAYREWCRLTAEDVVLGVAPLFHITGLIGHVTLALLLGAPLVLFHRFEPTLAIDTIREHRPTFTVGAITVFIALMNAPNAERDALTSLSKIWSGGAPIPPSTVEAFSAAFGQYIHNIYGLTETTSPSHGVPADARAPVDEVSGALAVGVPIYNTVVRIVGDDGEDLPSGETGEIVTEGPQVVSGYWGKPEETQRAIPGGALHTGDVGYMDERGWFYLVDRKKDQINAGGYKVWPREVEDVLYEHEAVREAAVVGVPDAYRGETVKAFVSLRPGRSVDAAELIAFCKERMAAYKYPRQVEFLDEIPKTVTGKVLRRELRSR
jgi:long-chain acyl-CoA synthetase